MHAHYPGGAIGSCCLALPPPYREQFWSLPPSLASFRYLESEVQHCHHGCQENPSAFNTRLRKWSTVHLRSAFCLVIGRDSACLLSHIGFLTSVEVFASVNKDTGREERLHSYRTERT